VLSIAVQPEQWDRIPEAAFAGLISNVALSSMAPKHPSNSIFFLAFFTTNPLSCPFLGGDLTIAAVVG
jgi:hypothetical protein